MHPGEIRDRHDRQQSPETEILDADGCTIRRGKATIGAGKLEAKLVKKATLKVVPGAPHGLCTTHAYLINEELLAFLKQ